MPAKEEGDSPLASVSKGAIGKGAVTGWLCRLSALRELCKEYAKRRGKHKQLAGLYRLEKKRIWQRIRH